MIFRRRNERLLCCLASLAFWAVGLVCASEAMENAALCQWVWGVARRAIRAVPRFL